MNRTLTLTLFLYFSFVVPVFADDYLQEKQSQSLLGTSVTLDVCYVDGRQDEVKAAMDRVWRRIEEIGLRTDAEDPKSDVSAINSSRGAVVKVNEDVHRLIGRLVDLGEKTDGMFDITIAPIAELWKRAAKEGRYPELSEINEAKMHIGPGKLEVRKDGSVRLLDPASRIDLVEVVPGFAVDEAVRILKESRFYNFMINAGSEIYATGSNCKSKAWRVGVKDPDRRERVVDIFELGDGAVSTSGDNERPIVIKGKRWSQIISPLTGYPQNGVANATVIAPTAVEASALSKALCVLGTDQGIRLIEELGEGYEALMLFRRDEGKYEWRSTRGYEDRRVDRLK